MNIDAILLSEYAKADPGGRLTVVGTFNAVNVPGLPVIIPVFYVSIVLEGHRTEQGVKHKGEIKVLNSKRQNVAEGQDTTFEFAFTDDDPLPGMYARHVVVSQILIQFQEEGPYSFEIHINDVYHCRFYPYQTGPGPGS